MPAQAGIQSTPAEDIVSRRVLGPRLRADESVRSARREAPALARRRTGDAAELIAGLGPEGNFEGGYRILSDLSQAMVNAKEAHHFHPVLFYFRFEVGLCRPPCGIPRAIAGRFAGAGATAFKHSAFFDCASNIIY